MLHRAMARVLIVANRLPVTVKIDGGVATLVPSAGGLASALRGPHAATSGLWIGWPGDVSRLTDAERGELDTRLAAQRLLPVHLTASEVAHYYDGFSNGVMWPLLHYQIERVRFAADYDFKIYEEVNRRFALAVAAQVRPGDIVWVHDYQLALVPRMLRELVPWVRIGFFLHVPFPSPDVFRVLPWDLEILRGMLGADLVGFQTEAYRANFAAAVALMNGRPNGGEEICFDDGGRRVRVEVHPIGVDVGDIERRAESEEVEREAARIREEARGKRILLGVDRLDYTKGIPRRLLAFDRLLERHPRLRDKVLFVQLAVPTREKVDDYADLRRRVNEIAGRVNAHHGTPTGTPISLLYRSLPFVQLLALYRAADVMVVTPLRDGMNLVAKEYVASRLDGDGALVLSEFAGAAAELEDALLVNPYDIAAVASAIKAAVEMPVAEQKRRMASLRRVVARQDVGTWVKRFLERLASDDGTSLGTSEVRLTRDPRPPERILPTSIPPR